MSTKKSKVKYFCVGFFDGGPSCKEITDIKEFLKNESETDDPLEFFPSIPSHCQDLRDWNNDECVLIKGEIVVPKISRNYIMGCE